MALHQVHRILTSNISNINRISSISSSIIRNNINIRNISRNRSRHRSRSRSNTKSSSPVKATRIRRLSTNLSIIPSIISFRTNTRTSSNSIRSST